jgi:hypothetical protein
MPSFIASVVDRGARNLAFRAALSCDVGRSSSARQASETLYKLRRPLSHLFLREMTHALASGAESSRVRGAATLDICLDETLADRLEAWHLEDAAELACTAERVEFEALFCSASGGHVVRPGNPLRPQVVAQCLATALREWPVRHALREAWFTHLGEPLGIELAVFYKALSRGLRRAGAFEAEFVPPVVGGRRFESWSARG